VNGCADIIRDIPDEEFYYVDESTNYPIGPLGGPSYRPWDFQRKERPSSTELGKHLETLLTHWADIAGPELARLTRPIAFAGKKARRLMIDVADEPARPPWGAWSHRSAIELERRTFTRFRAAINKVIAPHEVDHVDFTTIAMKSQSARPHRV
jgi:Dna[CI] antecedent, DciA